MSIQINRKSAEVIFVNKKLISIEAGMIINSYDLSDEEHQALDNFLEATRKLHIKSSITNNTPSP